MYAKDRTTISDRREHLRIKLKSLAEEARIIRHEERKTWSTLRDELHQHRVKQVRSTARHTHLAYGLIRGRKLEEMEATSRIPPDWKQVDRMWQVYGPKGVAFPIDYGQKQTPIRAIEETPKIAA